ncbi:MAG: 4Fe-4S dicluster domain-containing protein [Chloroflexota bacterium]
MVKRALLVDTDLCYGCLTCQVACQQEHGLDAEQYFIRVKQIGPYRIDGRLAMDFVPSACRHCDQPACLESCPEEAISKRGDGIVLIDAARCTGCQLCLEACPFGAPQFIAGKNIVQMCDLCLERLEEGLSPACVHHCPTGALSVGDPEQSARVRGRGAARSDMENPE